MRRLILVLVLIGCDVRKKPPGADSSTFSASSSPIASSTSPSTTRPVGGRSSCGSEVLSEEGIGEVRIGATVESVRQKCHVVRDTTVLDSEAMPQRELIVALSRDTVEAEIVNGRVWRIVVLSQRLRTADSLGVGTPLAKFLRLRNPRSMIGEGEVFLATRDHCGMSFRLGNAGDALYRGELDRAGLAQLPKSTVVSEVLIFGCHLTPAPRAQ